jgi:hypothetical protein
VSNLGWGAVGMVVGFFSFTLGFLCGGEYKLRRRRSHVEVIRFGPGARNL